MSENNENPLVVYVIAGEPSGDFLGASLMRALKEQSSRPIVFFGVGGERMEAEGLESLFPYHEISLMGFVEIIPHIFRSLRLISAVVEDVVSKQPDVVVTIDSPGFCFRVVDKLRGRGIKSRFVHYVAPTVWAYKPQRAQKCAELFDHMLVLLPFEPPFFQEVGLGTTFVGHPVICETKVGSAEEFRKKYEISPHTPIFCVLPGSRAGEVKRHMPIFATTIAILATRYPEPVVVTSVPEHALPLLAPFINTCPFRVIITADDEDKRNAMAASSFAFVKSGTVALEVAMSGAPMLVTYKVNKFSAWLLKRMLLTKFVNLVNILLGREVIPELLQDNSHPLILASCASSMLDSENRRKNQQDSVKSALKMLVPPENQSPSQIAAQKILLLVG